MYNTTKTFGEEILDQLGLFLAATFGLIVALAWNDAIRQATTDQHSRKMKLSPWSFALIVTVIAIVLMALWATFVASRLYPTPKALKPDTLFRQNNTGSKVGATNGIDAAA